MSRRKIPYSGKAKKEQLKARKQRSEVINKDDVFSKQEEKCNKNNADRYKLQLDTVNKQKETDKNLRAAWLLFFEMINLATDNTFVMEHEFEDYFPKDLPFPKRPFWNYNMDREELENRENIHFDSFKNDITERFKNRLGYWEQNLETWRQLWRVLEMSDIVFYIVDIRYVNVLFSPLLYDYCVNELKKSLVMVLNKIDLIPDDVIFAWMKYLKNKFPNIPIILFTSHIKKELEETKRKKIKVNSKISYGVALKVYEVCKDLMGNKFNLSSWRERIEQNFKTDYSSKSSEETFSKSYMTIGCIGQPNAGKSSFINAVKNCKVVSVSKTPGHTKHFQTIFISENVRLCDCPGLVFPSLVPKELQVLSGCYPVSQLSNPYNAIRFIAEHMDLLTFLKLEHPENDDSWSAMDVCSAWAIKRGFYTKRGARPDTYRAANNLLRMALDGTITIYSIPVNYNEVKDSVMENDEMINYIKSIKYIKNHGCDQLPNEQSENSLSEDDITEDINKFNLLLESD